MRIIYLMDCLSAEGLVGVFFLYIRLSALSHPEISPLSSGGSEVVGVQFVCHLPPSPKNRTLN